MSKSAKAAPLPSDPPSIAELAEQTRRSTPPPPPEDREDGVASLMEGFDASDLRYPFDSILPATLDAHALEELTPSAPFDLVSGRPSSIGVAIESGARSHYLAAFAGLAILSALAVAAPRLRNVTPVARAATARVSMTPAQAASWAAAPFSVDVPLELQGERSKPLPLPRETAPTLPHFDVDAAAVALAEAKSSLSECEDAESSSPAGARASVTFAPSGSVADVVIEPASELGAMTSCVVERLRAVRVTPFAGPTMTVRTTLALFPPGPKP